jgi:hypothetical protein
MTLYQLKQNIRFYFRYHAPITRKIYQYLRDKELRKDPHSRASLDLWKRLPREQIKQVFKGTASAEIDREYLGNILTYESLAQIIPKEWTVIDFGCSYNAQSFLFQEHLRHIAVDYGEEDYNEPGKDEDHWKVFRFHAPGTEFIATDIKGFIKDHLSSLDLATTFAICSWVPDEKSVELVRQTFPNLFVIYPASVKRKCPICEELHSIDYRQGKFCMEPHGWKSLKPSVQDDICGSWQEISREDLKQTSP